MKKTALYLFGLSLIINFVAGIILVNQVGQNDAGRYPLLSKRLFAEIQNDIIVNLAPLRSEIKEYLTDQGVPYSFYLEYLPSGASIRAGETDEFIGASLMKVPVIMDLYKAKELGKLKLEDKVKIDDQSISKKFGLLWQQGAGASIELKEAVKLAISESDNTAARLILEETQKVLEPKERSLNFLDVGLNESTLNEQPVILISARSYSSFLRCLYLSCYLDFEDSNAILDQLSKTNFHGRLEAGIKDKSIKVAHKIGTFNNEVASDCGIIYVPRRPYLFCLMLKSTKIDVDTHIAEVSKMAYEYISSVNTAK